jgi:hypothetical protein
VVVGRRTPLSLVQALLPTNQEMMSQNDERHMMVPPAPETQFIRTIPLSSRRAICSGRAKKALVRARAVGPSIALRTAGRLIVTIQTDPRYSVFTKPAWVSSLAKTVSEGLSG